MKRKTVLLILLCIVLLACKRDDEPIMPLTKALSVTQDTITFPMLLKGTLSTTQVLKIHNRGKEDITIDAITLQDGRYFALNVDGDNGKTTYTNVTVQKKDSIYLFVQFKGNVSPAQEARQHIADHLLIKSQYQQLSVYIQSWEQDIVPLQKNTYNDLLLTAKTPYHIFDTIRVTGTLTIEPGTICYMHPNAVMRVAGDLQAKGTLQQPIIFRPDRTDNIFTDVPYYYVCGLWGGIEIEDSIGTPQKHYYIDHAQIFSMNTALTIRSDKTSELGQLELYNSVLHNGAYNGLIIENTDATINNCQISNCCGYCVYLKGPGKRTFVHTTVADYYGYPYTNLRIFNRDREYVPAFVVKNTSEPQELYIYNSIISGGYRPALVFEDTTNLNSYNGVINNNYILSPPLNYPWMHNNVYGYYEDLLFENVYYLGNHRDRYYDFHLDTLSKATNIGSAIYNLTPTDIEGLPWHDPVEPGCYRLKEE